MIEINALMAPRSPVGAGTFRQFVLNWNPNSNLALAWEPLAHVTSSISVRTHVQGLLQEDRFY